MKFINDFHKFKINELLNLSKTRKWPTFETKGKWNHSDYYFVYSLPKSELGKYLNTWFVGAMNKSKDGKYIVTDEMITLKKVDKETASGLYNRPYNPVSIKILCPVGAKFRQNERKEDLYRMKAQIHSIDDSSFGIWWDDKTFEELVDIRLRLMNWINTHGVRYGLELNGEEFLDICVSMGADEDSRDYN